MKIDAIRPRSYFIDYIKVNWKFPLLDMSLYYRNEIKIIYKKMIPLVNELVSTREFDTVNFLQYDNDKKRDILALQRRKDIQIEWSGKFFAKHLTKKIVDDTYVWYDSFLKINEFIEQKFYRALHMTIGKDLSSHPTFRINCTVSRVDIARNHRGDLINATPVMNQNIKEVVYHETKNKKGKPYVTGIGIGKRNAESGIFFRAYDKRYDLNGIESSLNRFKTIYYVRKEWELKRKALRRFDITTPEDFLRTITDGIRKGVPTMHPTRKLTEIIYRLRKNSDCIMQDDNMLYRSIHDELTRDQINKEEGYTLTEHVFNKAIKRDYSVFTKKPSHKMIKRQWWNPMSRLNGIIEKKGHYLDAEEILILMTKLFGNLNINELKNDDEYQNKIKNVMEFMKIDSSIKQSLIEIEAKKKEVFKYTQKLIKSHKKQNSKKIGFHI